MDQKPYMKARRRLVEAHPAEFEALCRTHDLSTRDARRQAKSKATTQLAHSLRDEYERLLAEEYALVGARRPGRGGHQGPRLMCPEVIEAVEQSVLAGKGPWTVIGVTTHKTWMSKGRAGDPVYVEYATRIGAALELRPPVNHQGDHFRGKNVGGRRRTADPLDPRRFALDDPMREWL